MQYNQPYYTVVKKGAVCDYFYVGVESLNHFITGCTWDGSDLIVTGSGDGMPDLCPQPQANNVPSHLAHLLPQLYDCTQREHQDVGIHYRGSYQEYRIEKIVPLKRGGAIKYSAAIITNERGEYEILTSYWGTEPKEFTIPTMVYDYYEAPTTQKFSDLLAGCFFDEDDFTIKDPKLLDAILHESVLSLEDFNRKYDIMSQSPHSPE